MYELPSVTPYRSIFETPLLSISSLPVRSELRFDNLRCFLVFFCPSIKPSHCVIAYQLWQFVYRREGGNISINHRGRLAVRLCRSQ